MVQVELVRLHVRFLLGGVGIPPVDLELFDISLLGLRRGGGNAGGSNGGKGADGEVSARRSAYSAGRCASEESAHGGTDCSERGMGGGSFVWGVGFSPTMTYVQAF